MTSVLKFSVTGTSLPTTYIEGLLAEEVELLELVEIQFRDEDQPSFFFANHPTPIKWPLTNGNTYHPLGYQKDPLKLTLGETVDSIRLLVTDVSKEFLRMVTHREIFGARITIKSVLREKMDDLTAAFTIFRGVIRFPVITDDAFIVECSDILENYNTLVPRRVFQERCNYRFGDEWCSIDITKPEHNHFGTVVGSNNTEWEFDDNTIPKNPLQGVALTGEQKSFSGNDYWKVGHVLFLSGDNAGVMRAVRFIRFFDVATSTLVPASNTRVILQTPLPFVPKEGDRYRLRRGCLHTKKDCRERYDNLINFGGFPEQPRTVQVKG